MIVGYTLDTRDAVGLELCGNVADVEFDGEREVVARLITGAKDSRGVVMVNVAADGDHEDFDASACMEGQELAIMVS